MARRPSSRTRDGVTASGGSWPSEWPMAYAWCWSTPIAWARTEKSIAESSPQGRPIGGSDAFMTKSSTKNSRPSRGRARLARIRRTTDEEIERTSPRELADLPASFWATPELVFPVPKRAISLRVDEDVLAWFKASGPRYQSRMNAVLRSYMAYVRAQRK